MNTIFIIESNYDTVHGSRRACQTQRTMTRYPHVYMAQGTFRCVHPSKRYYMHTYIYGQRDMHRCHVPTTTPTTDGLSECYVLLLGSYQRSHEIRSCTVG